MPPVSAKQNAAMHAAAAGHSTLGIPKAVGREFVGPSSSIEAMTGLKKTHRGKRSRGKGAKHETAESRKAELDEHMKSGEHEKAKHAALHLAKALHRLTPKPRDVI